MSKTLGIRNEYPELWDDEALDDFSYKAYGICKDKDFKCEECAMHMHFTLDDDEFVCPMEVLQDLWRHHKNMANIIDKHLTGGL